MIAAWGQKGIWGSTLLCLSLPFSSVSPSCLTHAVLGPGGFSPFVYLGFFFFNTLFIYLFIYFWLCWVFVSVRGLSPVAESRGHSSLRCAGLSLSRPLLLRSTGSRRAGSAVVAHGLSCFVACGIFPDQGSNPRPLHWQADSQPLRHQGSPSWGFVGATQFAPPCHPSLKGLC